jgi:hypothetical protein
MAATARRCAWCGRFGGRLVRYQLWKSTGVYVRNLCPQCEKDAAAGPEAWAEGWDADDDREG